ncbi:MAG TPA: response regulator transcription factor [Burkholderiales bacterium]|nr:response regulator transcription factor [Burkholderiales bacterium]
MEPTGFAGRTSRPRLTPRQRDVLELLCAGLANKLISRQLHISPGTVKVHVGRILKELGATSRLQAVIAARELGLVVSSRPPQASASAQMLRAQPHA